MISTSLAEAFRAILVAFRAAVFEIEQALRTRDDHIAPQLCCAIEELGGLGAGNLEGV